MVPEKELVHKLTTEKVKVKTNTPKTIFIPFDMKPTDSMERLRDYYGYMIQTEIY